MKTIDEIIKEYYNNNEITTTMEDINLDNFIDTIIELREIAKMLER